MTNHHDELRVAPDPARAEDLRQRLHSRLTSGSRDEPMGPTQDAEGSTPSVEPNPHDPRGDLVVLETEARSEEEEPSVHRRRSPNTWLIAAAAAVVVAVVGTVLVASDEDDDDIDTVTATPTTAESPISPGRLDVVDAGTIPGAYLPRYSPDGSLLAAFDGNVLIHESETLTQLRELPCPTSLEYLPESVGTAPSRDQVWDVAAAERWDDEALSVLKSPHRDLCGVSLSADGSRAVTDADVQGDAPRYGRSLLWDTSDGSLVAVIPGSGGFSTDGSSLVVSNGPSFSIVDSSTGAVLRTITDDAVDTVSSPDGRRLLRWGTTPDAADGTGVNATIYDMQELAPVATLSVGRPDEVLGIDDPLFEDPVFDGTGNRVAALRGSGVTIWDASTGAELLRVSIELVDGRSVVFSPDGAMIAVRNGGHITIFDSSRGVQLADLDLGTDAWSQDVLFSPDGVSLASDVSDVGREESIVRVWSYRRTG